MQRGMEENLWDYLNESAALSLPDRLKQYNTDDEYCSSRRTFEIAPIEHNEGGQ